MIETSKSVSMQLIDAHKNYIRKHTLDTFEYLTYFDKSESKGMYCLII